MYNIQLQSGPFQFKDHEYLAEPLESNHRIEVEMKATQGGFTEKEVLRTLHGCIHGLYPQGVLYLFPTTDDVLDFSKSRFASLIAGNPESIGKFVKSGGKGTDSAQLKRVGNSYLYFRGAMLNRSSGGDAQGGKESSKLRGIPVDKIVYDEWDMMDHNVRKKAVGRMGHSKVKEERFLSNPTVPGVGIDALFQESDQRHWFRICDCKKGDVRALTCAELEFPDCVKKHDDGTGYIACKYCGKPLANFPGEWIPRYPGRRVIGRRWSQLSSSFNDPGEILDEFENPIDGNMGDVYRLRLGLPYVSKEDQLRKVQVYSCCSQEPMSTGDRGPCAMGVDVGKINHVIIGSLTGKNQYDIAKVARVSAFSEIHDLAARFNVRSAVIDIRPYEDTVREFQKTENYPVYLCQYNENTVRDITYNKIKGVPDIVHCNRTQIFDATHRMIAENQVTIPRRDQPEIEEFAEQLCNAYKFLDVNKRTNTAVYRYRGSNEHYRNALNYFKLAANPKRLAQKKTMLQRMNQGSTLANNNYKRTKF